jgi:hypothetical protein
MMIRLLMIFTVSPFAVDSITSVDGYSGNSELDFCRVSCFWDLTSDVDGCSVNGEVYFHDGSVDECGARG